MSHEHSSILGVALDLDPRPEALNKTHGHGLNKVCNVMYCVVIKTLGPKF